MTTYISPYTPALVLPQYKTTNYDPTLEIALLEKKQKDFDTFLARINNLKSQAINMTMLNEKGIEKLKNYNEELNQLLSGDPGDLSDVKVQSKIAGYFSRVAGDTDLKMRNKYSDYYMNENKTIENMKSSKDEKVRNGYNAINEFVYKNDEGGLYDFVKADDITEWNTKMTGYTPFKDIDQKMVNITKLLKEESKITQAPYTTVGPDGKVVNSPYFRYSETKGISPRRIQTLMTSMLDADEMAQFDVMTKYRIMTSDNESLFNTYDSFMSTNRAKAESLLNNVVSQKELFNPAKLSKDATDEKRAEYTKLFGELQEQEEFYKKKLEYFDINTVDKDAFTKLDKKGKFGLMRNITVESYIEGVSNALKTESTTDKFVVDPTYFQSLNYNLNVQREANNQWNREQLLRLKEKELQLKEIETLIKAEKGSGGGSGGKSDTAVVEGIYFADDQKVIPTLEEFEKIYDGYNKALEPLITNGDPKNFNDNQWLSKNSNNFEVKLWAHYKTVYNEATLEGFKTYLRTLEMGDGSNDSAAQGIYRELQNAQDLRNFYDSQRTKIYKRVGELVNIDNVTAPGGTNTLSAYAKGRKNDKGELIIGVPNDPNKTSYNDMTWSEIRKELIRGIQESKNASGSNWGTKKIYEIINAISEGTISDTNWYEGKLKNDAGLFETIKAAFIAEQRGMKDVGAKLNEIFPNYAQHQQVKLTGDKITTQYTGQIQEAFRTHPTVSKTWWRSAETAPIVIENDDVESVILPTVGTNGGYTLSSKGAEKIQKAFPGLELTQVDGKIGPILPNVIYKFNTSPIQNQNIHLNIMFNQTGEIKRKIHGYDVEIKKNVTNPGQIYVFVPKISETPIVSSLSSVDEILNYIDSFILKHKSANSKPQPTQ